MTRGAVGRPDAPAPLGPGLDFLRVIWALSHALERASRHMATTLGITGPQRLILRITGRFPGLPAGHLARLLHVHPSTLTGTIRRLERAGLLRRRPDPRDGRRSLLGLTAQGRRLDVETSGSVEFAVAHVLEATPRGRVAAARAVLEAIAVEIDGPLRGARSTRTPTRARDTAPRAAAR